MENESLVKITEKAKCCLCKKIQKESVVYIETGCGSTHCPQCWLLKGFEMYFANNPEAEYVMIRGVKFIGTEQPKKVRSEMTIKLRFKIIKRDNFQCTYCGSSDRLEVDHIIPVSRGGSNEESNLTTACFKCNRGKSNE